MQKIVQVHMLPTEKPDEHHHILWLSKDGFPIYKEGEGFPYGTSRGMLKTSYKPQHLYFTSDEEIKGGEWVLAWGGEAVDGEDLHDHPKLFRFSNDIMGVRKIVATTNPELWKESIKSYGNTNNCYIDSGIPKIPLSFVKEFVEKQGNIKEVKIECIEEGTGSSYKDYKWVLKLDSQGCVIISPIEEKIDWEQVFDNAQSMHLQEFISYYKQFKIN